MIHAYCRRSFALIAAIGLTVLAGRAQATPASAVFTIDQSGSSLKVTLDPPVFGPQDDTQNLTGTLDAVFDFGTTGAFPTTAQVTVTGSHVAATGNYDFTFGFPPLVGIAVHATGIVADTTTPSPPGSMTKTVNPATYQFDAAQFDIGVNQGMITITGSINDSRNLADEPVSGSSPLGTNGTVAFAVVSTNGPYTLINAALTLPIDIARTLMFGDPPQPVDIQLDGTVKANASFYAALSGVPADFNSDNRVDDADYAIWQTGFGTAAGAMLDDGDANADGAVDGDDFLVWQQNYGMAPPPLPGASSVPEPTAAALISFGVVACSSRRRRISAQAS